MPYTTRCSFELPEDKMDENQGVELTLSSTGLVADEDDTIVDVDGGGPGDAESGHGQELTGTPSGDDANCDKPPGDPAKQAEALERLKQLVELEERRKRQERIAFLSLIGQAFFFLYQVYDVLGVLMDVIADIVFYAEFRTVYPEERGLHATLLLSMILPLLILTFVIYRKLLGFRPPPPKREITKGDDADDDYSSLLWLEEVKGCFGDLWVAGPLYWILAIMFGAGLLVAAALLAGVFLGIIAVLLAIFVGVMAVVVAIVWVISDLSTLCGADLWYRVAIRGGIIFDMTHCFGVDMWHHLIGMPSDEFLPVRGIIYFMVEDIPQLTVQIWVLLNRGEDSDLSAAALAFAFVSTILNVLNQFYKLWKRAMLLKGGGLSFWRYLGHTFGLVRPNKSFAVAYASLIQEGKYDHQALDIRCASIGDDECIDLIDAIEYNHKVEQEKEEYWRISWGISKLTLAHNCIGDRSAERIAEALEREVRLYDINIQGNQVTDIGAKRLALAIRNDSSWVTSLNLRENPKISKEGYDDLVVAAQERGTMLTFSDCDETDHLRGIEEVELKKRFWEFLWEDENDM